MVLKFTFDYSKKKKKKKNFSWLVQHQKWGADLSSQNGNVIFLDCLFYCG